MTDIQTEIIQLKLLASLDDWSGYFDQLEVWRSRQTSSGPWEELTAEGWKAARVPMAADDAPSSPVAGPLVNIVDKELELLINENEEVNVTFTGTDPLEYGECATQITGQGLNLVTAYVTSGGDMVVESVSPGNLQELRVVGGDAAPLLGLPTEEPDSFGFGRNPRISLIKGEESYEFTDAHGSIEYWYRTRYRNNSSKATSDFSTPFQVPAGSGISPENMVVGRMELVNMEGRPLANREVGVRSTFRGTLVDGKHVVTSDLLKSTGSDGTVEFTLPRGLEVTVSIAGTDLVKKVTVPTDSSISSFNLLDPEYSDDEDYFKVRVPAIPYAARRSL
jgi:hypothetical protein